MRDKSLKLAQNRLLEMALTITNILDANHIKYMLSFGTLLGAVRHKGFIPWDDDFDIQIFSEDYENAINTLDKNLPNNLFLENQNTEPKFFHGWSRIRDNYTIVEYNEFPQDNVYSHKGLTVDLFIIKKMPLNQLQTYINDQNKNYIERRKKLGLIEEKEYKNRINKLNEDIKYAKENPIKDNRLVYGFTTTHKRKYLEVEDVWPPKPINFEDYTFLGPANPLNVVKAMYNNYLVLPPQEQRRIHYSSIKFLDK